MPRLNTVKALVVSLARWLRRTTAGCGGHLAKRQDLAFASISVILSGVVGSLYLFGWLGTVEPPYFTMDYAPAIYWAAGKGLTLPNGGAKGPEVEAFLRYERPSLQKEELTGEFSASSQTGFSQFHRYLMCTLGMAWRVFGISWNTMRALLVILLCVTVLLVYCLFRLAIRSWLSLFLTLLFLFSPGVLAILPRYRDFSKAPFIFGVVLILGLLLRKPAGTKRFLLLAGILGLVQGIGLGFRQDLRICLPISILVLLTCIRQRGLRSIPERLAGVGLMIATFLLSAWPILNSMQNMPSSFHHMVMGLATVHDDDLGVTRASYERAYVLADLYAYAASNSYASRAENHPDPIDYQSQASAWAEREFLLANFKLFPGDFLTRAYAASLWAFSGAPLSLPRYHWVQYDTSQPLLKTLSLMRAPISAHLERFGVVYAALALLIISSQSLWTALLVLGMFLYFCGYTSLQFQYRHSFHLTVVSLWTAGFVLQMLITSILPEIRVMWRERRFTPSISLRTPLVRSLLFAGISGIALLIPLYAARAYQAHRVSALLDAYSRAELEGIPTESRPVGNWTLFHPTSRAPSPSGESTQRDTPFRTEYLAALFKTNTDRRTLVLRYDTDRSQETFSHGVVLEPTGSANDGETWYFFPVYESPDPNSIAGQTEFAGIALPNDRASDFKGLYRVSNLSDFPLLLNFSIPSDHSFFRTSQQLKWLDSDLSQRYTNMTIAEDPRSLLYTAREQERRGDFENAANTLRTALSSAPGDLDTTLALIDVLDAHAKSAEAAELARDLVVSHPESVPAYGRLKSLYTKTGDAAQRIAEWRNVVNILPTAGLAYDGLADALEANGDLEGAKAALLKAAELRPTETTSYVRLAKLQIATGDAGGAIRSYWHATGLDPHDLRLHLEFGRMFRQAGDLETASQVFLDAIMTSITHFCGLSALVEFRTVSTEFMEPAQIVAVWRRIAQKYPDCFEVSVQLGTVLMETRNDIGALKAFHRATQIKPSDPYVAALVGQLFERQGNHASAISTYKAALAHNPNDQTLSMFLSDALEHAGNIDAAIDICHEIIDLYPQDLEPRRHLARLLAKNGDLVSGLDVLRDAIEISPAESSLYLDIDQLLAQYDEPRRLALWRELSAAYPENAAPWVFVGDALLRARELDAAIESYSKALTLDPQNTMAIARLEQAQNIKAAEAQR